MIYSVMLKVGGPETGFVVWETSVALIVGLAIIGMTIFAFQRSSKKRAKK